MSLMEVIIVAIVSYLIGSIPFAVIISRAYNLGDITKFGSGNPGATNMMRLGGKKLAALTFLLDASKGAFAVWLATMFDGENVGMVMVVLGHCFSIFLRFHGGKGVATTLGGLLLLCPIAGVVCVILWLVSFVLFRISAVSALISINVTALLSLVVWAEYSHAMMATAILVSYRHKSNIKKLLEGKKE